jgi:hypothetical protein
MVRHATDVTLGEGKGEEISDMRKNVLYGADKSSKYGTKISCKTWEEDPFNS